MYLVRKGRAKLWLSHACFVEMDVEVDTEDEFESDGRGGSVFARTVEASEVRIVSASLVLVKHDGTEEHREIEGDLQDEQSHLHEWLAEHPAAIRWF